MLKFLVTGAAGQLGKDVVRELENRGYEVTGSGSKKRKTAGRYVKMDITDRNEVEAVMKKLRPDIVIHCAAWTAVDAAEAKGRVGHFPLRLPAAGPRRDGRRSALRSSAPGGSFCRSPVLPDGTAWRCKGVRVRGESASSRRAPPRGALRETMGEIPSGSSGRLSHRAANTQSFFCAAPLFVCT